MKKILAVLLAGAMALSLIGCSKASGGTKVGVSMPTKDLQRWNQDGSNMKSQLEKAGYKVDLQYAANDIPTQVSQIENMITSGCKVLVIASIDGSALKNPLDEAKKKNIKVIAYDRLIMNTNAVSYYATFDNYKVGTIQGDYLVDKLKLKSRSASDPVYMEFFTGDPGDNNINFFFGGAMDVLKPYLDKGVIVCPSGQTAKAQCATLNWSTEEAQKRMENLITSNGYGPKGTKLDAGNFVLSGEEFVPCAEAGVLPANKAYLPAGKIPAGAKAFTFDFGESTGINDVQAAQADGAIYSISGVRVAEPQKGVYIMNGRKVIVK